MSDPFGALATQRKGDTGIFDGTQYQTSGNLGADVAMRIVGPQAVLATSAAYAWPAAEGRRLTIYDGSAAHPVSKLVVDPGTPGLYHTPATMLLTRAVKTSATKTDLDDGSIVSTVISYDGADTTGAGRSQATGISSFIEQNARGDALGFGTQVVHKGSLGGALGYYTNVSQVSHTCTITHASPAVVTATAHGLPQNRPIYLDTSSALPSPLVHRLLYYVDVIDANSFHLQLVAGSGTFINTTSNGSGTHYFISNAVAALNPLMVNGSEVDYVYDGNGSVFMANIGLQVLTPGSAKLNGMGIWFVNNGSQWSEGIVVDAGVIANQTFYDLSSSAVSIEIKGDHATAAIRILNDNSNHYAQQWYRTSATAVTWGLIIDNTGNLRLDEPGVAVKMAIIKGTPGANNTDLQIQEGAGPTMRHVQWVDPGAAGINLTAGQMVMVLV